MTWIPPLASSPVHLRVAGRLRGLRTTFLELVSVEALDVGDGPGTSSSVPTEPAAENAMP
jgi:hypothetical protein